MKCWILTLFCGTDARYINERSRSVCGKHWRVVGIIATTADWTVLRYANISPLRTLARATIQLYLISQSSLAVPAPNKTNLFPAAFQNFLLVLQWWKSSQTWKSIAKSALNSNRIKHRPPIRAVGRVYHKAVFSVKINSGARKMTSASSFCI